MPQLNTWAMAHVELFSELEQQASAVSPIQPEIEIDSVDNYEFGNLYRVWCGMALVGTFFRSLDGSWVSQPCNTTQQGRWASDKEAIDAILAA